MAGSANHAQGLQIAQGGAVAGFADATGRFLPLVATLNAARVLDAACRMLGVSHEELSDLADFLRPSVWPNTPDILTEYLQFGGVAAYKIRAALAAMSAPSWGMYAGYELIENVARPGSEENIDNEKYEYKNRHWADYEPGGSKAGRSLAVVDMAMHPVATLEARGLQLHSQTVLPLEEIFLAITSTRKEAA